MTSITCTAQWSTRRNQMIFAVLDLLWRRPMLWDWDLCYYLLYANFYWNRTIAAELRWLKNDFQYGGRWPSAILNLKKINIWSHDCHWGPYRDEAYVLSCVPNLIKIGLLVPPPDTHNCWMFNMPLLGNGHCHGNRIMADMSETWWDVTTQVLSKLVSW